MKLAMGRVRARLLGVMAMLVVATGIALGQLPVPAPTGKAVNDYANVLAGANARALEAKLNRYFDTTSTQIVIVTERTSDGQPPADRALDYYDAWGIGTKENNNGVLVLVEVDDRQIYIQTGYGVEDRVTDAMARRIIDQVITPNFRAGRYFEGLDRATDVMIDLLAGRYKAEPRSTGGGGMSPFTMLILFFVVYMVISYLFRRRGGDDDDSGGGYYRGGSYRGGRRRRGGMVILRGGGFGGGGFGGGGGGGFGGGGFGGGFGGGMTGGGGAGGGW